MYSSHLAPKLHSECGTYDPLFVQHEIPVRSEMAAPFARPVFSGFWPPAVNFQPVSECPGYNRGYRGRFRERSLTGLRLSTAPAARPAS
jgi:hypothetical protein